MRFFRRIAILAIVLSMPALARASDFGQQAATEVTAASYRHYLDDQLFTHDGDNRGRNGADHNPCRSNIAALLTSFGLSVQLEPFTYSGHTYYNVVGTQTGVSHPNTQYVVGAHYDSVSNPGADDNASGVAGVLEAARVLSQYELPYTVKYVAFDLEELGLLGSGAYAYTHRNDDIRGMISLDMISWAGAAGRVDIYALAPSRYLRNAVRQSIHDYAPDMAVAYEGASHSSDHAPFEHEGFPACLLIEDNHGANPCYHEACDSVDTPDYIDYELAANITRVVTGFLADPDSQYCAGDVNGDGQIDLTDLATLLMYYGTTSGARFADGDLDRDGDIDIADLALLLAHYGTSC